MCVALVPAPASRPPDGAPGRETLGGVEVQPAQRARRPAAKKVPAVPDRRQPRLGRPVPRRLDDARDAFTSGPPLKKVAKTLCGHRELILNWFRAQGEFSSGAVEGLNNKVKLVTRKSYGFRTANVAKLALLHNLGRLPEPESIHRFC